MKNIYPKLLEKLREKTPVVLAVTVDTTGSSPQVPGASALFTAEGLLAGTLGGGMLEADSGALAAEALKTGESRLLTFTMTADISRKEEAVCGGEALILIDARPGEHQKTFQALVESLDRRRPGVLVTRIDASGEAEATRISRSWVEAGERKPGEPGIPAPFTGAELEEILASAHPRFISLKGKAPGKEREGGAGRKSFLYMEPLFPLPRLVIAGAGHIGRALCHLGSLLDFEVTVIDDRPRFANPENLPQADRIVVEDIGKAVASIPKAPDTYIVIVTRGHSHDAEALRACINSRAGYIGMIGSRRKIALMREAFLQNGWASAARFDRVHAPIGLDIGSKTVQEIAVSIAAELVLVRNRNQPSKPQPSASSRKEYPAFSAESGTALRIPAGGAGNEEKS